MELLDAHDATAIARAARALAGGDLVAFPTETVYGLGANALDEGAVQRIFEAKGRPSDNPLIVHISSDSMRSEVSERWPQMARELADAFWPGPLTLVVPHASAVAGGVVAGLPTVAVRWPDHPVALALIAAAGVPIAAPSANRSGRPSPTTSQAVLEEFADARLRPAFVLDGGPASIGVESTVVDVTGARPVVLRHGGVPMEAILAVRPDATTATGTATMGRRRAGGERSRDGREVSAHGRDDLTSEGERGARWAGNRPECDAAADTLLARSPGTRYRHYAPDKPLWVFTGPGAGSALLAEAARLRAARTAIAVLAPTETAMAVRAAGLAAGEAVGDAGSRSHPAQYAAVLFDALRRLGAVEGVERILAEAPDATGIGRAVADRLARAATHVVNAPPNRLLFVCSGNTCRSPMAAALALQIAGDDDTRDPASAGKTDSAASPPSTPAAASADDADAAANPSHPADISAWAPTLPPLETRSAGVRAVDGQPAAAEAIAALREWGSDLSSHRSHAITDRDIAWADLVITMEDRQARQLRDSHPDAAAKIVAWRDVFHGSDVSDPFGRGAVAYKLTVDRLAADLRRWFGETRGGVR